MRSELQSTRAPKPTGRRTPAPKHELQARGFPKSVRRNLLGGKVTQDGLANCMSIFGQAPLMIGAHTRYHWWTLPWPFWQAPSNRIKILYGNVFYKKGFLEHIQNATKVCRRNCLFYNKTAFRIDEKPSVNTQSSRILSHNA